mmetsp:Transcript_13203/g.31024  ORF Transcript_13203/g.31024 Transcript_13203/m.31024 type:complete len:295 (+) Transcript_13203:718-1602(+)
MTVGVQVNLDRVLAASLCHSCTACGDGFVQLLDEGQAKAIGPPHQECEPGGRQEDDRAYQVVQLAKVVCRLPLEFKYAWGAPQQEIDTADRVQDRNPPYQVAGCAAVVAGVKDAIVHHLANAAQDETHAANCVGHGNQDILCNGLELEEGEDAANLKDVGTEEVCHRADPRRDLGVVLPDLLPVCQEILNRLPRFLLHVDEVEVRAVGAGHKHDTAEEVGPLLHHSPSLRAPIELLVKNPNCRIVRKEERALHEEHSRPVGGGVVPHELAMRGVVLFQGSCEGSWHGTCERGRP